MSLESIDINKVADLFSEAIFRFGAVFPTQMGCSDTNSSRAGVMTMACDRSCPSLLSRPMNSPRHASHRVFVILTFVGLIGLSLSMRAQNPANLDVERPATDELVKHNVENWGFQGRGLPDDWSHRHLMFSNPGTEEESIKNGTHERWLKIAHDPRYIVQQMKRNHVLTGSADNAQDLATQSLPLANFWSPFSVAPHPKMPGPKRDWAVSLGTGTVAQNMSPAKFGFDINATPSCTNDFVVYGLNVAGSTGGQANMVALNNLYSGETPASCGANTAATPYWAYNVSYAGGNVTTSPVLSLDGRDVIFVESGGSTGPYLHILVWNSADGGTATASIAPAKGLTGGIVTSLSGCTANESCLVSILLNSTTETVTNSSPFYDYANDIVYVGDDAGNLYKVTPVLGPGTPTVTTTEGGTLAPGYPLTSPVYDATSGYVFVGATNGVLYGLSAGGDGFSTSMAATLQVGDTPSSCSGGDNNKLTDSPMVDSSNGWVYEYATTGNAGAHTDVNASSISACGSGASTCTAYLSNGPASGETTVVWAWWAGQSLTATLSDSQNNTYTAIAGPVNIGSVIRAQMWYVVSTNAPTAVTLTLSGNATTGADDGILIGVLSLTGLATSSPLDTATVNAATGSGASMSVTSGTPTTPNEMMLGVFMTPNYDTPWSGWGSGWSDILINGCPGSCGQEAVSDPQLISITSETAQTAVVTGNVSQAWGGFILGLELAEGTGCDVSGNCHTVVVQASTAGPFTTQNVAAVGEGDGACNSGTSFPTHSIDFDNNYYVGTSGASGTIQYGHIWVCGRETSGSAAELWEVPTSTEVSGSYTGSISGVTPVPDSAQIGEVRHAQCSPFTEIYNGTTDYLFFGEGLSGSLGSLYGFTLGDSASTSEAATEISGSPITYPDATGGTSAIVIDNVSTEAQASSIYFTTLGTSTGSSPCTTGDYCAIKLTQSALK